MFLCFPFVGRAFRPSLWPSKPPSTSRRHPPSLRFTPQIPSTIKTTRMHGASGQMNGGNRETAKPRGHFTGADVLGSAMSTGGRRKASVRKAARNLPQGPSCVCVSLQRPVHGVVRGPWGLVFPRPSGGHQGNGPARGGGRLFRFRPLFFPLRLPESLLSCLPVGPAGRSVGRGRGCFTFSGVRTHPPCGYVFSSRTNPVRLATFRLNRGPSCKGWASNVGKRYHGIRTTRVRAANKRRCHGRELETNHEATANHDPFPSFAFSQAYNTVRIIIISRKGSFDGDRPLFLPPK